MRGFLLLLPFALIACDGATAQKAGMAALDGKPIVDAVKADLGKDFPLTENARFTTAFSDLNGDGTDEVLVYLSDQSVCGSGGCNLYVLTKAGDKWAVENHLTIARPPIYRLSTSTNGWADLGVTVSGGGLREAVMKVSRRAGGYASNPSMPPAVAIDPKGAMVLISSEAAMAAANDQEL